MYKRQLIGIILLIGIVKKNAIMMIDFALQAERDQGLPPVEAIYQACLLRFRPIMMTTMAALFGGLPLAIGMGVGSELQMCIRDRSGTELPDRSCHTEQSLRQIRQRHAGSAQHGGSLGAVDCTTRCV